MSVISVNGSLLITVSSLPRGINGNPNPTGNPNEGKQMVEAFDRAVNNLLMHIILNPTGLVVKHTNIINFPEQAIEFLVKDNSATTVYPICLATPNAVRSLADRPSTYSNDDNKLLVASKMIDLLYGLHQNGLMAGSMDLSSVGFDDNLELRFVDLSCAGDSNTVTYKDNGRASPKIVASNITGEKVKYTVADDCWNLAIVILEMLGKFGMVQCENPMNITDGMTHIICALLFNGKGKKVEQFVKDCGEYAQQVDEVIKFLTDNSLKNDLGRRRSIKSNSIVKSTIPKGTEGDKKFEEYHDKIVKFIILALNYGLEETQINSAMSNIAKPLYKNKVLNSPISAYREIINTEFSGNNSALANVGLPGPHNQDRNLNHKLAMALDKLQFWKPIYEEHLLKVQPETSEFVSSVDHNDDETGIDFGDELDQFDTFAGGDFGDEADDLFT